MPNARALLYPRQATTRARPRRGRGAAAGLLVAVLLIVAPFLRHPAAADDTEFSGDWGGLRPTLDRTGFDVGLTYIGETFGSLIGGIHRGAVYEDRVAFTLDANLAKLALWPGATAHATLYEINGRGPSATLVGNLLTVSGIEALPSTRLFTLWLEQRLLDGRVSIRLGQIAMDDEFFISGVASNLLNSTFGNPAINYSNQIAGGPVYPVADPGVRLELKPRDDLTLLGAVFAANPGGNDCGLGVQVCDPSGITFSFAGGTLWVGELQYSINQGKSSSGLPGTYKLGGWHETGSFADQEFGLDLAGRMVSLAAPDASGPLDHASDFALYGIADQMLWRQPGSEDIGLSGFFRIGGAPANRNMISFYCDGGLSWKGLFPDRGDDYAVLGIARAAISPAAASLVRQQAVLDPQMPIPDFESVVELTYLAQIRPWWSLQPDLQYVIHPGGNVANPNNPAMPIRNALVLGLRTTITF